MKNKILLIGLIPLLLAGCNNDVSSSKNSQFNTNSIVENTNTNSSEIDDSSSSSLLDENEALISINYVYKDGGFINQVRRVGKIGETYKFVSQEINFMEADEKEVEFVLSEEGYSKTITYDYSYEEIGTINKGDQFTKFMIDETKGVSFSYVISNNSSHWNSIIENDTFVLYNAYLRGKNKDYVIDFKSSSAIKSNNFGNDALLVNGENEIYVSISVNPDHSITFFKNGELTYTYLATMRPNESSYRDSTVTSKYLKDLVENVFSGIEESGFRIGADGSFNIKDLTVGYSLNNEDAKNLYEKKNHLKVEYIDEFGNRLLTGKSKISNDEIVYNYTSQSINGYTVDKEVVSGTISESKTEYVTYTFDGVEQITKEMKDNNLNVFNRYDTYDWSTQGWYQIANEIEGDFMIRMNYHLKGAASQYTSQDGGNMCWRTNLNIIEDSSTKDRFVNRLDWYGWMNDVNEDGKNIGSNPSYGTSYLDDYNLDIFNVYNDCTITQLIKRQGTEITQNYIIIPNKPGYEGKRYDYNVNISNINSEKLNIAFAAEDAIVTFNSIKIKQL